jgi:hypothetical protein
MGSNSLALVEKCQRFDIVTQKRHVRHPCTSGAVTNLLMEAAKKAYALSTPKQ